MSNNLQEISRDALREMYAEAEPPLDFDDVLENPEEYGSGWYAEHYLDGDRQAEIVERHCDENNLTKGERTVVMMTTILNYGPSSVRRTEVA